MMDSHLKQPKYGVPVRIGLVTGDAVLGLVFVQWGQRVRDLVCEKEAFLPVRTRKGTVLLNKVNTVQVDVLSLEEIKDKRDIFPDFDMEYLSHASW